MNLHQKIPEWLPLDGLRVRIQHYGMQKLCNGCYGNHIRKDCENEKISWKDYIEIFKEENPEIPASFYGKWSENTTLSSKKKPTEKDFNIPTTQDELNEMMTNMMKSGFDKEAMMNIFKDRKAKLIQALEEHEKVSNECSINHQCQ